jgi:hypothetical protein
MRAIPAYVRSDAPSSVRAGGQLCQKQPCTKTQALFAGKTNLLYGGADRIAFSGAVSIPWILAITALRCAGDTVSRPFLNRRHGRLRAPRNAKVGKSKCYPMHSLFRKNVVGNVIVEEYAQHMNFRHKALMLIQRPLSWAARGIAVG